MDDRINRIAALANVSAYDEEAARNYADGAPHVKHASLRTLYAGLVVRTYDAARALNPVPEVLDLGAGEGSATLPFLELGAKVTAVDISSPQLKILKSRCDAFSDRLEIRCEDIAETLKNDPKKYQVIVLNSFLHHVPDYMSLLTQASALLAPGGQIFTFQDPLRYDSLGPFTTLFCDFSYLSWRIFKGDVTAGIMRRLRRRRGIYLAESMHDNAEYHMTRNGVDQDAIRDFFVGQNFDCTIESYFSTQSSLFQPIGAALGIKNTFAVIARKK
ncbi:MAG: class I SAM-dependent methyltransferase [Stenotrophobium sp.]